MVSGRTSRAPGSKVLLSIPCLHLGLGENSSHVSSLLFVLLKCSYGWIPVSWGNQPGSRLHCLLELGQMWKADLTPD